MPKKTEMSTYLFGRLCEDCGTDPSLIGQLVCLICRAFAFLGLSVDWFMLWSVQFIALAQALEFEGHRYERIRKLVKALRPKMPGFHKFQADHRPRVLVLLIQALVAILIQVYYVDWIAEEDTPIWPLRWIFAFMFGISSTFFRFFVGQPRFYCQDPAKVQQSISADSADGPFYLYRDGWKCYPIVEALVQDLKPKSQ